MISKKMHTSIKPLRDHRPQRTHQDPGERRLPRRQAVRFERCTFTRLGGGGLDLEFGAQDNMVTGCHFLDISGTAIQVGDVLKDDHHPDDPRMIVKDNAVRNNVIHDVGVEYKGGVGVFAGYMSETVIAHNEIFRLPYSGISVGWGWGEEDAGGGAYPQPSFYQTPTPAKNNRIEYNHIHHVMQVLNDGGGIYTLGNMPGTVIRGNHIHDNPGIPGGIYLDEGSGFIEVTGNLVHGVPTPMNYNNRNQNRIATCKSSRQLLQRPPDDDRPANALRDRCQGRHGGSLPRPSVGQAEGVSVNSEVGMQPALFTTASDAHVHEISQPLKTDPAIWRGLSEATEVCGSLREPCGRHRESCPPAESSPGTAGASARRPPPGRPGGRSGIARQMTVVDRPGSPDHVRPIAAKTDPAF